MDFASPPDPDAELAAVRIAAFLVANRTDAGLRHHGHHQSGARQFLHDRRLPGLRAGQRDRQPGAAVVSGIPSCAGLRRWVGADPHLYKRDHLEQVLLTYGLILIFEQLRSMTIGRRCSVGGDSAFLDLDPAHRGHELSGIPAVHLGSARARGRLYYLMAHPPGHDDPRRQRRPRHGRRSASTSKHDLPGRVRLGVALAALAGMLAAPISSVFPNMGSVIISFVIVVIGGIGSVWGALVARADRLRRTFGKVPVR